MSNTISVDGFHVQIKKCRIMLVITPWDSFTDSRVKLDSRESVRIENKTAGADSQTPCTEQEMLCMM